MALAGRCKKRCTSGQMTVELAVAMPVFIALMLVVGNVLAFVDTCARFDRLASDYVRIYCASPGYGVTLEDGAAQMCAALQQSFPHDNVGISVDVDSRIFGHQCVQATLSFSPQLAGRPLAGSVFGVSLPSISHSCSLVIDPYRPGAVL